MCFIQRYFIRFNNREKLQAHSVTDRRVQLRGLVDWPGYDQPHVVAALPEDGRHLVAAQTAQAHRSDHEDVITRLQPPILEIMRMWSPDCSHPP